MADSVKRSVVKALSWRITGTLSILLISLLLTSSFSVAGSIALAQFILNLILYFIHERIWDKLSWGKN